jgi:hypothetical protein
VCVDSGAERGIRAWTRRFVHSAAVVTASLLLVAALACVVSPSHPSERTTPTASRPFHRVVLTYFYYWYDAATDLHLGPGTPLALHPPSRPTPSWHNARWYMQQLSDMSYAGIDVALAVYWGSGSDEPWSTGGLPYLVKARHQLVDRGQAAPTIGLFLDTTITTGLDLTQPSNIESFYGNVRTFYATIPRADWATVHGRPIIWLFLPQENEFDQSLFEYLYSAFKNDFGVLPYIVRATGWDCAMRRSWLGEPRQDCSEPIRSDASYVWGAAQDGVQETSLVASVGPGYDERQIPGRPGVYRPRAGGQWYRTNLCTAVESGSPFIAIETWNEFHEGSAISRTVEYGGRYINLNRAILSPGRSRARGVPAGC